MKVLTLLTEINAYETREAKFHNLQWHINSAVQRIYNEVKKKETLRDEKLIDFITEQINTELAKQQDGLDPFSAKTSETHFCKT